MSSLSFSFVFEQFIFSVFDKTVVCEIFEMFKKKVISPLPLKA